MEKEQLNSICEKIVLATIAENEEKIVKELAHNLSWEDGWEKTISRAAFNATKVSATISVQILLDILLNTGLFKFSEEVTRPHLVVLPGGLLHEQPEKS